MEGQEVHLCALQVLKDEDEDDEQGKNASNEGRPSSTEAGLSLARVRFPCLRMLVGGTFDHLQQYLRYGRASSALSGWAEVMDYTSID
jgi:hypothetical protein